MFFIFGLYYSDTFTSDVPNTLLHNGCTKAVCTLMSTLTTALLSGHVPLDASIDSLYALSDAIKAINDLPNEEAIIVAGVVVVQSGPVNVRGRRIAGQHAIHALLDILLLWR